MVAPHSLCHTRNMTDFTVDDHGSIVLLRPETLQAWSWILANLGQEVPTFAGAIAIERKYVQPILLGLVRDDLTWETPTPTSH